MSNIFIPFVKVCNILEQFVLGMTVFCRHLEDVGANAHYNYTPYTQGLFLGGQSPLVKMSAYFGGSAPLKLLHWLGFSEFIGLASIVL